MATTFTVTTDQDANTPGSLRWAITSANTTPGNDVIDFNFGSGSSPYVLYLASGLPTIIHAGTVVGNGTAGAVTINGLGSSSLTISGSDPTNSNDAQRNFNIFSIASGGNLSISDVTLSGARTTGNGGAFDNQGTLTVSDSIIAGNTARNGGAILNNAGGTLTVTNSTLSSNTALGGFGGGILNRGNLAVSNSTFSNNTSFNGGGILNTNSGTLTVTNSTLSGNTASANGGGIFNDSTGVFTLSNSTLSGNTAGYTGGGIRNSSGIVTVTNSTISSNTSDFSAGISATGGTTAVTNSTLFGNVASSLGGGIGIFTAGTIVSVSNSTLSGNSASGGGGGIYHENGTLNIANTIIANSTSGGDYAGTNNANVNVASPSTAANNLVSQGSFSSWAMTRTSSEINLGSLQNNGGPTQTLALLAGSVARRAGNAAISNSAPISGLDQRGIARSSTAPSIGAYEYTAADPASPSSGDSSDPGPSQQPATPVDTTPADPAPAGTNTQPTDADGDGLREVITASDGATVDGNRDGIPDVQQTEVAGLRLINDGAVGSDYGALVVNPSVRLGAVTLTAPSSDGSLPVTARSGGTVVTTTPDGITNAFAGVVSFNVSGVTSGGSTQATINFPSGLAAGSGSAYIRFNYSTNRFEEYVDASGNPLYAFVDSDGDGILDAVNLTLVDGDPNWDGDGSANGTVVDPGFLGSGERIITGTKGGDTLIGNVLANTIYGKKGRDWLEGDLGNDILKGSLGNDHLYGGEGADQITGGRDKDRFIYTLASDSSTSLRDTVKSGSEDRFVFRSFDGDSTTEGQQQLSFIGKSMFTGVAGELRATRFVLEADLNGDSLADFAINLRGNTLISSSNLVL